MEKKIKIVKNKGEHDEKTCFRCRLYELWEELRNHNDPEFILLAMAEASGSLLSQFEDDAKLAFMSMVMRTCHEDEQDDVEQSRRSTKH